MLEVRLYPKRKAESSKRPPRRHGNPALQHAAYDKAGDITAGQSIALKITTPRKRNTRSGWRQADHSLPEVRETTTFVLRCASFKTPCNLRDSEPPKSCARHLHSLCGAIANENAGAEEGGKEPPRSCGMRPITSCPESRVAWESFEFSFSSRACFSYRLDACLAAPPASILNLHQLAGVPESHPMTPPVPYRARMSRDHVHSRSLGPFGEILRVLRL